MIFTLQPASFTVHVMLVPRAPRGHGERAVGVEIQPREKHKQNKREKETTEKKQEEGDFVASITRKGTFPREKVEERKEEEMREEKEEKGEEEKEKKRQFSCKHALWLW